MKHLFNVLAHASVAAILVVLLGLGVHLHAPVFAGIGLAVAIATLTLLPGVFSLIGMRMWFNLVSAGRLAEIATFGIISSLVFKLTALFFPHVLSITTCAFEPGFATAILVVPLALFTGNLKNFTRRSWLPVRMKSDPR